MTLYTLDGCVMENSMGKGCCSIPMGKNMRGNLLMDLSMEKESIIMRVGSTLSEIGKTIKNKAMEYISITTGNDTREIL